MQFIVISHQLLEILWAATLGIVLGLLYDVVRFVRRLLSPLGREMLFANIFDVAYLIFAGASYCVFLFVASNGRFRWFTALALVLGFAVYRLLPGRLIKPFVCFLADLVLKIFGFLLAPVRMLICLICKAFKGIFRFIGRKHQIRKTERMKKQLCREVRL